MLNWLKRWASGWVNKDPGDDYWYTPRGVPTAAGVDISEGKALGLPTVFACVNKIAKTMASLPIQVYERTSGSSRKPVDHPLNELFGGIANPEGSAFTVNETRMANVLLWGMGYNRIVWSRGMEPLELIPLESAYVTPKRNADGGLVFEYKEDGQGKPEIIIADDMFWVPGLSIGGIIGLSVIRYHRDTVGVQFAKRQFGGSFFKNGARVGGLIKRSMEADRMKPLSKEGAAALLESFNAIHQGSENAFKWGLLREDMTAEQLPSMPLEDAQYVEGMQFDREDVCGIFDVPPSKIQDHTHSTFSNIEHLDIAWAKDTILPWCVRLEQAVHRTFFGRDSKLYLKHNLAGLVRGDINSRYQAYAVGRQWGWFSINDIRQLEDMNPIPDGDDYLQPLNMQVVGEPPPEPAAPATPPPADDEPDEPDRPDARQSIRDLMPVIAATCRMLLDHEAAAVEKAYKRLEKSGDRQGMDDWLTKFAANHAERVAEAFVPVIDSYQRLSGRTAKHDAAFIGSAWSMGMVHGISTALDAGDLSGASRMAIVDDQAAWVSRIILGETGDE